MSGARHALFRLDLTRHLRAGVRLVLRFGVVGLLAFVVDVGCYNLFREVADLGPLTSKTASVVLATTVAFLGNRSWTFAERRHRRMWHAYLLFFAFNGVALLISLACLAISTYVLGLTSALAENVAANVVGLGLGMLFRFWAYHRWVFPSGAEAAAGADADRGTGPERRSLRTAEAVLEPAGRSSQHQERASMSPGPRATQRPSHDPDWSGPREPVHETSQNRR